MLIMLIFLRSLGQNLLVRSLSGPRFLYKAGEDLLASLNAVLNVVLSSPTTFASLAPRLFFYVAHYPEAAV